MEDKNKKQPKLKRLFSAAVLLLLFFVAFEIYLYSRDHNISLSDNTESLFLQQNINEKAELLQQNGDADVIDEADVVDELTQQKKQ